MVVRRVCVVVVIVGCVVIIDVVVLCLPLSRA